nr:hypothetical protein [Streptomyces sp. NRRL WC-3719]
MLLGTVRESYFGEVHQSGADGEGDGVGAGVGAEGVGGAVESQVCGAFADVEAGGDLAGGQAVRGETEGFHLGWGDDGR